MGAPLASHRFLPLLAALALLAAPGEGRARPVTRLLDVKADEQQFFKARSATFVVVDDPSVATAELLPSGEVFLQARKAGRALMLVGSDGTVYGFRIRVRDAGGPLPERAASDEELAVAKKACRALSIERSPSGERLSAEVATPGCRDALRTLLDSDTFLAGNLHVTYSVEALQAQLEDIRARLRGRAAGVELTYAGAALRLRGTATSAERTALMKVLYEAAVGPVLFEEELRILPGPAETSKSEAAPGSAPTELPAEAIEVERGTPPPGKGKAR